MGLEPIKTLTKADVSCDSLSSYSAVFRAGDDMLGCDDGRQESDSYDEVTEHTRSTTKDGGVHPG